MCTWHAHRAGMHPKRWHARAFVTYLSWSLPTASVTWTQWWDRELGWARDGSTVATCLDLPRESVTTQLWIVSLHLPTVAARLAVVDPEILLLRDEDGPGIRLEQGMEVQFVSLPNPVTRDILEGLHFTRGDGADVWVAVHRHLPEAWHKSLRPPGRKRLLGVDCRVWAANGPCPPVVVWPGKSGPGPSLESIVVLLGWVTARIVAGHAFTAPRGRVVETDGTVALQLAAEPPTTHVVVVTLQWGAERPQPRRDPIAKVMWRDLPTLQSTILSGGVGRQLPGALPWHRDCADASAPPTELRSAPEGLYGAGDKHGPRHHLLVATDHTAQLWDNTVGLVADMAHCLDLHAMILPREGWEGRQHTQTAAAPLVVQYVAAGGLEVLYLDHSEVKEQDFRH